MQELAKSRLLGSERRHSNGLLKERRQKQASARVLTHEIGTPVTCRVIV